MNWSICFCGANFHLCSCKSESFQNFVGRGFEEKCFRNCFYIASWPLAFGSCLRNLKKALLLLYSPYLDCDWQSVLTLDSTPAIKITLSRTKRLAMWYGNGTERFTDSPTLTEKTVFYNTSLDGKKEFAGKCLLGIDSSSTIRQRNSTRQRYFYD